VRTRFLYPKSRLRKGIVASAGYPFPIMLSIIFSFSFAKSVEHITLALTTALMILSLPLVRSLVAVLYYILLIALSVSFMIDRPLGHFAVGLLTGLMLIGGIIACVQTLGSKISKKDGSDIAQVSESFFIPIALSKAGLALITVFLILASFLIQFEAFRSIVGKK